MKKIKITIFMYSLGGGGVQRFVMNLLNNLSLDKYEVTLALVKKEGVHLSQVPRKIEVVNFNSKKVHFSLLPLIKHLNKEKPDILFSIDTSINIVATIAKLISKFKGKLIIRQAVEFNEHSTSRIKLLLAKILYPRVDKCIVLSNDMKENLINTVNLSEDKIQIIYNSIDINNIIKKRSEAIKESIKGITSTKIIAVGRLTRQKNFLMLLEAFEIVVKQKESILIIIGEGEEKEKLLNKAKELGIKNKVFLLGYKDNPYKYIYNSDIFVLPSIYEGLSNALLEALACEIPIVTTNNPDKIIQDSINGFQVSLTKEALAEAIIKMLENESMRQKIISNNKKYSLKFDIDIMVKSYENLFSSL